MKIGIVSAQKHCKTHLRQLKADGHDVYCLGARPAQIPPSYDALVVRIASMRHCDSYKEWAKDTGRPVIYEDGLSGIRRELAKIPTSQPKLATASISVQEIRDRMVEWGAALVEARPQDNRNTISRHLTSTLNAQFPSMAANSKALVSSVVGELFSTIAPSPQPLVNPPKNTASTADPVVLEPSVPIDLPTQLRPPSPENPWRRVYTEVKCELAYQQAIEYLGIMGTRARADLCHEFKRVEKGHKMPKTFVKKMEPHVRGKPLMFVTLVYLVLPEHTPVKKALNDAYRQITGKGSDTRLWKAAEWFLGRETPIHTPTVITPTVITPPNPEPQGLQPGLVTRLTDAFSPNPMTRTPAVATIEPTMDNTPTIIGLLDTVERMEAQIKALGEGNTQAILEDLPAHKSTVQEVCNRLRQSIRDQSDSITAVESKLDEAIKAGFDPRTNLKLAKMEKRVGDLTRTEVQNFKHEVNRTLGNTATQNDLASFRKDIDASIKAKIKVLDDSQREVFKALQTFGSESGVEHSAYEDRIRGLERCWDDLQGQVPTLVGQAAGAVEHRLREDISNAFDALAAEQQPQTPDLSSNPFAALEQVKAALKAAGFKGTLTLTIE